eukprot:jgi/Mesvir1/17378/Mv08682-RA.1
MSNKGQVDLEAAIDWRGCESLNEKNGHPFTHALKKGYREDAGLFLESDIDEQLLVTVPFNQVVKLHSIVIKAPDDGSGPKNIKLFINKSSLGFSEAAEFAGTQELELTPAQLAEGTPIPLKFVKFQSVRSVTVFMADNQGGGETTRVCKLQFIGTPVETTNMNDFKKIDDHA